MHMANIKKNEINVLLELKRIVIAVKNENCKLQLAMDHCSSHCCFLCSAVAFVTIARRCLPQHFVFKQNTGEEDKSPHPHKVWMYTQSKREAGPGAKPLV